MAALTNVQELEVKKALKVAEEELDKKYLSYDKLTQLTGYQTELISVMHKTVAKGTTISELAYFLSVCKGVGLNPLNKEIWCYKNTKDDVIIFTGRDGFLKKNKENPLYRGMRSSEVCEFDEFEIDMISGEVKHIITNNRGSVLGAYAIVSVEGQKDTIVYLDFDEFNLNQAKWKMSPKMMIKKCAQAHALKEAAGITGIQPEEAFVIRNNTAYSNTDEPPKSVEDIQYEKEEERLLKMIESAKTLDGLKKLINECSNPDLIAAYDKRKKELEGK